MAKKVKLTKKERELIEIVFNMPDLVIIKAIEENYGTQYDANICNVTSSIWFKMRNKGG